MRDCPYSYLQNNLVTSIAVQSWFNEVVGGFAELYKFCTDNLL